jgi:hypothetical protein
MSIIEVNVAGFQFTRCEPDVPGGNGRRAWRVTRTHHKPRFHAGRLVRKWAPRFGVA